MNISAEIIKKLRKETGAGIVDVKKALEESNGDEKKAVEVLRKKGEKIAMRKQDREVKEGVIAFAKEGNRLAIVELYCETDFVARNEDFIAAGDAFAQKLLTVDIAEFKSWAEEEIKNSLIVKIGENLQLGKFKVIEGDVVDSYLHTNKKVASVVVLSGGDVELAHSIALQVAAMNPLYLSPKDVPEEEINSEKEIMKEQLKKEGKPEKIWDNIIKGKINKYYEEVCLEKQPFIEDDKKKIEDIVKEKIAKLGENIKILQFTRFSL